MKAKKIYYSIVVGLQSLFILLLFVNIGYCIITSDLTMFPTTALYLNFYPFMNFLKHIIRMICLYLYLCCFCCLQCTLQQYTYFSKG